MKISRIIYFFIALVLAGFQSVAQGSFSFKEDKHDFGTIDEGTQAVFEFEFINTGTAPIILTDVRASCGCTTPSWTRDPIPPGGKGTIKASFNSEGRPGTFSKSITVTSNATEATKILYIKGIVMKKEEKPVYTEAQLKASPKLLLDKTTATFGKVERGQKVNAKFTIKNTGKGYLKVPTIQAACNCITQKLSIDSIAPGKSAVLEITYGPAYDGKNTDIITLISNDKAKPRAEIILNAEVVESLSTTSPLKEEKTNVPFGK